MRAIGAVLPIGLALGVCGSTPPKSSGTWPAAIASGGADRYAHCAELRLSDATQDAGWPVAAAPTIDPDMRGIVSASRSVVTVRSLSGKPICIPLSSIDAIEEFYLSGGGRLLDFDHSGFEDRGHFLIDRSRRTVIETGTQPESSDDGTMLVAVPPAGHDEVGIDAIGVWQVLPDRIATRAMLALPDAESWRVERWVGNACAELSAVASADYWGPDVDGGDDEAAEASIAKLPRLYFRLYSASGVWRIDRARSSRPCLRAPGSTAPSA